MKNTINSKYQNLCSNLQLTCFTQVTNYLTDNNKTTDENGNEILTINFPGNYKYNFNSRMQCDDMQALLGSYFQFSSKLKELDLSYNKLLDEGTILISSFLENAENIEKINFMGNQVGDIGCEKLAHALRNKRAFHTLNLNSNQIGNSGIMHITELLFTNSSLLNLDVGNNLFDWDGLIALTTALTTTNSTLQLLNVDDPQYKNPDQDFFTHFGKMFQSNTGLKKLSMQLHKINFEGASYLMHYLRLNTSLLVLDLSSNQLCFQAMSYISEYINETVNENQCMLQSLVLKGNKIRDAGAKFFAIGIYNNTSLVHVDLTSNKINDEGLCRIAEGIIKNQTLKSFKLFSNNNWGKESIEMFREVLKEKGEDFYPDFDIYDTEYDDISIAYLETHIPYEHNYLV